jgi:hypothetical protein
MRDFQELDPVVVATFKIHRALAQCRSYANDCLFGFV